MIQFTDRLTLGRPKRTSEGYMAVRARAARTGLYDYRASEIGAPADKFQPNDIVKVYRDESEVFSESSIRSFIARPITNDHPRDAVTSRNWRDHSRGVVMGAVRDGEYLAFDLVLMDQKTIADVDAGKRELSNGYQSMLDWTAGLTPDGKHYDAKQTTIRGNHVAVVDAGRAGESCCISDAHHFALCDAIPTTEFQPKLKEGRPMKLTNLDGLSVNLEDSTAVEQALARLDAKVTENADAVSAAIAKHDKEIAAKDAEIAKLQEQTVDQAKISELVDEKLAVITAATKMVGDKLGDTAGKTVVEIQRMTCDALGIDTKDKSDEYVGVRFEVLVDSDTTANDNKPTVPLGITNPVKLADNGEAVATMRASRYF